MSTFESNLIRLLRLQAKIRLEILSYTMQAHLSQAFADQNNDQVVVIMAKTFFLAADIETMQLSAENEETVTYQNVNYRLLELTYLVADLVLRYQVFNLVQAIMEFTGLGNSENPGVNNGDASQDI